MIETIQDLAPYLADENKARELFERLRWPNGPVCPHCKSSDLIYRYQSKKARLGVYKCGHCRKQFTATVGTIFEGSHIPLSKWLYAVYLMCSAKKGVSAKQLERELGISYKAAWFMCHRIRYAMTQPPIVGKLSGTVEIDETYIGGKPSNNRRRPPKPKPIVMAMIERGGAAKTFLVSHATRRTLENLAQLQIEETSHIMTDKNRVYHFMDQHFAAHDSIDHSKEYVRGIIHTNFAESYFSLLKRGIFGTFHHVSAQHMPRYLREFEFKWNNRKTTTGQRTMLAIQNARGKRLLYKQPNKTR